MRDTAGVWLGREAVAPGDTLPPRFIVGDSGGVPLPLGKPLGDTPFVTVPPLALTLPPLPPPTPPLEVDGERVGGAGVDVGAKGEEVGVGFPEVGVAPEAGEALPPAPTPPDDKLGEGVRVGKLLGVGVDPPVGNGVGVGIPGVGVDRGGDGVGEGRGVKVVLAVREGARGELVTLLAPLGVDPGSMSEGERRGVVEGGLEGWEEVERRNEEEEVGDPPSTAGDTVLPVLRLGEGGREVRGEGVAVPPTPPPFPAPPPLVPVAKFCRDGEMGVEGVTTLDFVGMEEREMVVDREGVREGLSEEEMEEVREMEGV